jgi:hypothetical protein
LGLLDLVTFDLWGPYHVQSAGGKVYLMIIIDAGTSFKYGAYLPDKSDATVMSSFETFCAKAETPTGKKIHWLQTDRAYESHAWGGILPNTLALHTNSLPRIHLPKMVWLREHSE